MDLEVAKEVIHFQSATLGYFTAKSSSDFVRAMLSFNFVPAAVSGEILMYENAVRQCSCALEKVQHAEA